MKRRPTVFQNLTLSHLKDGWELIDDGEKMHWLLPASSPDSVGYPGGRAKVYCEWPKSKRYKMQQMAKHQWVEKVANQWKITAFGIEAHQRFENWIGQ